MDITQIHNLQQPWFEKVKTENQFYVNFKLDTGSQVNLFPLKLYKILNLNKIIESSTIKIEVLWFKIISLSSVKLNCTVNNISALITFLVINNNSIPILNFEACI